MCPQAFLKGDLLPLKSILGATPATPLERVETSTTDKEHALCGSLQQDSKHMRPIFVKN